MIQRKARHATSKRSIGSVLRREWDEPGWLCMKLRILLLNVHHSRVLRRAQMYTKCRELACNINLTNSVWDLLIALCGASPSRHLYSFKFFFSLSSFKPFFYYSTHFLLSFLIIQFKNEQNFAILQKL